MDRLIATSPERARQGIGILGTIAIVLQVIGGVNWALVGLFNLDLVAALFGNMSTLSRVVYVLVGVAALYALSLLPRISRLS